MLKWLLKRRIAAFERTFGYDASYLREMLDADVKAVMALWKLQGMSRYRKSVPREAYYAAAIAGHLGADCVVRFFEGIRQQGNLPPPEALHRVRLNGLPGVAVVAPDGTIDTVSLIEIRDGKVVTIYAVRNPDKLKHLSLGALRSL